MHDERLTLAGLFFETHAGLVCELDRALDTADLPQQWFEILLRLARTPENRLRMSDLARQVTITPSGLTRAVDRMATAGLVRREACASDRRVLYAALTPKGRRRIESVLPDYLVRLDNAFIAQLDAGERTALEAILRKLRAAVRPESEAGVAPAPVPQTADAG